MERPLPSRERVFLMLNLYHFVNDAIVFLIPTLLQSFYTLFEMTYTQSGLIIASHLGMVVLGQIVNGYLADKNMEKGQFLTGMSLLILSTYLLTLSHNFTSLLIYTILNGLGLGFIHAILYVLGAKLYPHDREIKQSRQGFSGDFGKLLSIVIASIILAINPDLWKIPIYFWTGLAILIFLYAAPVIVKFPFHQLNGSSHEEQASEMGTEATQTHEHLMNPPAIPNYKKIRILLFTLFIMYTASQEVLIKFFTLYLNDTRTGLSVQYARIIYALMIGAGTYGVYISGNLKKRFGFQRFLTYIYILNIISLTVFVILPYNSFISDIGFAMVFGFTILSVYITIQSELSFYVSFKKLGLGYGLLLGIGWFGGFLANLSAGILADHFGPLTFVLFPLIFNVITIFLIQTIPSRVN